MHNNQLALLWMNGKCFQHRDFTVRSNQKFQTFFFWCVKPEPPTKCVFLCSTLCKTVRRTPEHIDCDDISMHRIFLGDGWMHVDYVDATLTNSFLGRECLSCWCCWLLSSRVESRMCKTNGLGDLCGVRKKAKRVNVRTSNGSEKSSHH